MGQIRHAFPGGNSRFKKLLFATVAAPVLQQQDYQTSLKLAFGKNRVEQIGPDSEGPIPEQFTEGLGALVVESDGPQINLSPKAKFFRGRSASRLIN